MNSKYINTTGDGLQFEDHIGDVGYPEIGDSLLKLAGDDEKAKKYYEIDTFCKVSFDKDGNLLINGKSIRHLLYYNIEQRPDKCTALLTLKMEALVSGN